MIEMIFSIYLDSLIIQPHQSVYNITNTFVDCNQRLESVVLVRSLTQVITQASNIVLPRFGPTVKSLISMMSGQLDVVHLLLQ